MLAWNIWNKRNDIVWNGKSKLDGVLIKSAQDDLMHWKMAIVAKNNKVQTVGKALQRLGENLILDGSSVMLILNFFLNRIFLDMAV